MRGLTDDERVVLRGDGTPYSLELRDLLLARGLVRATEEMVQVDGCWLQRTYTTRTGVLALRLDSAARATEGAI